MSRSTILSLPLQLAFPGAFKSWFFVTKAVFTLVNVAHYCRQQRHLIAAHLYLPWPPWAARHKKK
jgi:hypothetical protein